MNKFGHGGDVEAFAKEYGYSIDDVVDLSSNINFLKPNIDIDFNKISISSYPKYDVLIDNISSHYEVKSSNISLYNGGSSAIFYLINHLNNKKVYIYSPAYVEYKRAVSLNSTKELTYIDRLNDIDSDIDSDSIVIFVNPSTPDGKLYDIDTLMQKWIAKRATIIIDESFIEFTDATSATKYLDSYSNLYILKSMTKLYSCAGVRVGIIISSSTNIDNLEQYKPLWQVSEYDSHYISSVLKDKEFVQTTKKITKDNYTRLYKLLSSYDIFDKVYSSDANFVLVRLKSLRAIDIQKHLAKYKIMVRDCSNFDFLDNRYIRVAVKSNSSIDILKKALDEL
jgi:threonine-phosphate decarboxylase